MGNKTISVKGNKDTGSVKLDGSLKVGDRFQVSGETKQRIVTYVMQDKQHVCTGDARSFGGDKKQGPLPLGDFEVTLCTEAVVTDPVAEAIDQMNAAYAKVGKAALTAEEVAIFKASVSSTPPTPKADDAQATA